MNYRELGATGIKVSEIGLGCEGLNGKDEQFTIQFMDKCFEYGINCMDLYSPNPDLRKNLAKALKGRRDKFILQSHICSVWKNGQYERTRNLDPQRERLYEECQSRGVGITVMKVFGGGDLLNEHSPAGMALTANQCIHYALTRPAVGTVFVGAHSLDELEKSVAYETASDSEKDYAKAFSEFPKINWQGHCMYCGHCAPCPKEIDIAAVTKFLNLAKAQGAIPETVREHYKMLKAQGGDCISCGSCEKRCPFSVSIRKNMAEAAQIFGY